MSFDCKGFDFAFEAAADLSSYQFYVVNLESDAQVAVVNAGTDVPFGVLQDKPAAAARAAQVRLIAGGGISKVVSDGSGTAIAIGDRLTVDTSGKAVKSTADADYLLGVALEASSADGTIIAVALGVGIQRAS